MDESLKDLIASGGIEGFIKAFRQEWQKSFWLMDKKTGKCLYQAGKDLPEAEKHWALEQSQPIFFAHERKLAGCTVVTDSIAWVLLLGGKKTVPVAGRRRLEAYRLKLLICARLEAISQKRRWQREQELMEVLFCKREGIEQFLHNSMLELVEDYAYVVQLIFFRTPQPREKFDKVADLLESFMRQHGILLLRPVFWRNRLVHVMPAPQDGSAGSIRLGEAQLLEQFRQLAEQECGMELAIGIGNRYPLPRIFRSYDEACQAVRFNWQEKPGGFVQRFADLGYFVFLLSAPKVLQMEYINKWLGPLLDYDHEHHTELLPMLEYLLYHTFDWTRAAKHFDVRPNTLRYRVQRIEEILGCSLQGNEMMKFELFTALKLRTMLSFYDMGRGQIGPMA